MPLLFAFLSRAWPYILAAILLGVLAYKANTWCNGACKDARAEVVILQAEKKAAQERATAIALLWSAQVDKTEAEVRKRDAQTASTFGALVRRAEAIDSPVGLRIGGPTARLLLDASRAANAAAAPAEPETPPDAVSEPAEEHTYSTFNERELATAWIKAAMAYTDAVGQWRACVDYYEGLRNVDEQK